MLPVAEALDIVLQYARSLAPTEMPLGSACGRVLAEDVASDIDSPPFDKALMDGYAVRSLDLARETPVLPVAAEVTAGQVPPPLPAGQAIRIMTGAPIPDGADAVVKVEQTKSLTDGRVRFNGPAPKAGQNILPRGQEMRRGDVVLRSGIRLTPQAVGILASVGRSKVLAFPAPRLSLISTGDELVEPTERPGPGQLRNSNATMLLAQAASAGADAAYLGIARDRVEDLTNLISTGLRSNVLVLSGGVSAGKLDLVPQVLRALDVEARFHHVAMKPGKPLFFGTRGETLVFGLPGNPVSSFCGFELFVRPALRKLSGCADVKSTWIEAAAAEPFKHQTDRPTYHPAWLDMAGGRITVRVVPWFGSPDLRALVSANALVLLPAGSNEYTAGQLLPVLPLD